MMETQRDGGPRWTLLTAKQAAIFAGTSSRALLALARAGRITHFRLGVKGEYVRFDKADVLQYKRDRQPPERRLLSPREVRTYLKLHDAVVAAGQPPAIALTAHEIALAQKRRRVLKSPPWADRAAIAAFYERAKRLSAETGIRHEVDHVIPLRGSNVSGLHVETNLQVISSRENQIKGNRVVSC